VLPDLDKMVALGSARIFGLRELDHPLADALGRVTADMLGESRGSPAGRDG
jgi:hypothetical protein